VHKHISPTFKQRQTNQSYRGKASDTSGPSMLSNKPDLEHLPSSVRTIGCCLIASSIKLDKFKS
jgi:hypothetical protein